MKIPSFKPSKKFVNDIEAPCLVARGKNSQLPRIAVGHRAECDEDPVFTVYLRSSTPKEITVWQQSILEQLFTRDGLVPAVEAGVKAYEKSPGFSVEDLDEEAKRDGLLAHVYLIEVIIDDCEREVMLVLSSVAVGDIDEHGLVIHGPGKDWQIDQYDCLNNYLSDIERGEPADAAPPKTALKLSDFIGRWVMDVEATKEQLRKEGGLAPDETVQGYRDAFYEVSESAVTSRVYGMERAGKIVSCDLNAKSIVLEFQNPKHSGTYSWGGRLRKGTVVDDIGMVWRRTPATEPLPEPAWKSWDPSPLFGCWTAKKEAGIPTATLEITSTHIAYKVMGMSIPQPWTTCLRNGDLILFWRESDGKVTGLQEMKWVNGQLRYNYQLMTTKT